ncbi:MAG: NAD(P)H-hydrate dehydratase [Oscillospiraceae bacterium]|nr:NAD(P)H-hydrate dehydratase [Oscillospiraceae bacterium]
MNDRMNSALRRMQALHRDGCVITTEAMVRRLLPKRHPNAHKGDFGRVLIVAGAVGYTGAPVLAANAALRSGAGLIFTGVPEAVYPIVAQKLDEPMVFPLVCDDAGRLDTRAIPELLRRLGQCDACLVGPGLGRSPAILDIVKAVLTHAACPVILDADGINCLEGHIDTLGQASCPVILTPHDGEFQRLGGDASPAQRYESAKALARAWGVTVLLKGHRTLIVSPEKSYLNTTGNPGMATGGSGDVLAGILLALLGQGAAPTEAAAAAAWIHGAVGDYCAETWGERGMTPTDMIANLHVVLQ